MSLDISDGPPELPRIGSLDLSTVRNERNANKGGLAGDHELATGEIPMSPRASSEAFLMTPRTAMGKKDTQRVQFTSASELHGEGPVAIASNGDVHASIGVNGKLALWDAVGSRLLCQVTLQLPADLAKKQESKRQQELEAKPPRWLAFDCAGSCLGIHRPGIGLWLCKVAKEGEGKNVKMSVTDALMLGDGKMSEKFTSVSFSSRVPGLLAVGTDSGRVMLFSPKSNKLTAQKEGKHPGKHVAIVAGDWLKDGRLAVASHERMKVSAPIDLAGGDPEWKTFAKFYIAGMTNKIPIQQVSTTKTYDSTPGFVAVSLHEPPYIAMTLGDKVVTIMDYSGVYKEEGFFIPLDYGHIVGMVWVAHEVVLIALANGYVVLVSAPLLMRQRKNEAANAPGRKDATEVPTATKSMSTTRIFSNYLSACIELEGSPAVLGDKSLKVLRVDMAKWGTDDCLSIAADIEIEGYDARIGTSLNAIACHSTGSDRLHLALTSTGGLLHGFSLPGRGAAVHGA